MIRALLCALALSACASAPYELPAPALPERAGVDPVVAARAEGVRVMADGEAPRFHLRFYDDRIALSLDGAAWQDFPLTEPVYPRWNGEIYTTRNDEHALSIAIRRYAACPTEAGQHVVDVTLDEVEMHGCGRAL